MDKLIALGATFDSSKVVSGVARTNASLDRLVNQGKQVSRGMLAMRRIVGAAFVAMGAVIVLQVRKMLRGILDLGAAFDETKSKFDTTFGASAASADAFNASFARMAGLSITAGREVLATTGAIAQGMGFAQQASSEFAREVVELAGDIASFNNRRTQDVAQTLQRAISGERESLKTLGIVINQVMIDNRAMANSGKEAAAALSQQDRATASLQLITEAAGVAVGDLVRTQTSTQNRMKQAGAAMDDFKTRMGLFISRTPALKLALEEVTGLFDRLILSMNADDAQEKFNSAVVTILRGVRALMDKLEDNALVAGGGILGLLLFGPGGAVGGAFLGDTFARIQSRFFPTEFQNAANELSAGQQRLADLQQLMQETRDIANGDATLSLSDRISGRGRGMFDDSGLDAAMVHLRTFRPGGMTEFHNFSELARGIEEARIALDGPEGLSAALGEADGMFASAKKGLDDYIEQLLEGKVAAKGFGDALELVQFGGLSLILPSADMQRFRDERDAERTLLGLDKPAALNEGKGPSPLTGGILGPAFEKDNEEAADDFTVVWDQALRNMQDGFAQTFKSIFTDGLDGFRDFADRILEIFQELSAQLLATKLFDFISQVASGLASGGATKPADVAASVVTTAGRDFGSPGHPPGPPQASVVEPEGTTVINVYAADADSIQKMLVRNRGSVAEALIRVAQEQPSVKEALR